MKTALAGIFAHECFLPRTKSLWALWLGRDTRKMFVTGWQKRLFSVTKLDRKKARLHICLY
jgi:hypothetical protein